MRQIGLLINIMKRKMNLMIMDQKNQMKKKCLIILKSEYRPMRKLLSK